MQDLQFLDRDILGELFDCSRDLFWSVDGDGRWTYLSRQAAQSIFGCAPESMMGRKMEAFGRLAAGEPMRVLETAVMRGDGSEVHLEINAVPLDDGGFFGTAADTTLEVEHEAAVKEKTRAAEELMREITVRRQVEEQLRAQHDELRFLACELSTTADRERRKIAADLHDRIGQNLAAMKRKVEYLKRQQPGNEDAFQGILELATQTMKDTSSLTFEISPPILYDLGFSPTVEYLLEQFEKSNGICCTFEDDARPKPLDDDMAGLIFQAVRELLMNVAKHAEARHVKVAVGEMNGYMEVTVDDDGRGFDMEEAKFRKKEVGGFGLLSIRERLTYAGGGMKTESHPGRGTQMTLLVPLKGEEDDRQDPAR